MRTVHRLDLPRCRAVCGERALVTGAGSGIGRSVAIRLAQEGARIGLVGRRTGMLEETAASSVAKGRVPGAALRRFTGSAGGRGCCRDGRRLGCLDVLVAVAGIELYQQGDTRVDQLELEVWQKIIAINLTGMFLSCKHAVRAMLKGGKGGSVIITGSPTGIYGLASASTLIALRRPAAMAWCV